MPDRKKVIKGLEMCAGTNEDAWEMQSTCVLDCPYTGKGCIDNLMFDALALLKEQEAVKPEWHDGTPFCGNCGHRLEKKNRSMNGINCRWCGRPVKWE